MRHLLIVVLALSLAGCEASNLVVLDRPDASAAGDAVVAECAGKKNVGTACAESTECCSGLCAIDPLGQLTCRQPVGCKGIGASCSTAGECCSLGCAGPAGNRTCSATPCAASGATCAESPDCCSGRCSGNACAAPPTCRPAGEVCAAD